MQLHDRSFIIEVAEETVTERSLALEIAAETLTDYRSVLKRIRGGHVRGSAGIRINAALRKRGLSATATRTSERPPADQVGSRRNNQEPNAYASAAPSAQAQ